jgi:hypothetical protein
VGKTKADLERDVANLKAQLSQASGIPPKEREAAEARADTARKAVQGITVDSVVKEITDASLSTVRALSSLSETLTAKTRRLEEIDLAIQVKQKDLEALFAKEVIGSSLAALVEDHDRQKLALESEIAALRQQWDVEKAAHAKLVQERNDEALKTRIREEEQYKYERDLRRRNEETVWKNAMEDAKRAESLRAAEFERNFQSRESALKARESEFIAAMTRIAGIQDEIDAAVKKEVATVASAISRDHKHASELASRDHASQVAQLQAQLHAAKDEVSRLSAQVTDLGVKLSEAYAKNVSLSEKALDAASGRQALTELRDLQTVRAENNGSQRKS